MALESYRYLSTSLWKAQTSVLGSPSRGHSKTVPRCWRAEMVAAWIGSKAAIFDPKVSVILDQFFSERPAIREIRPTHFIKSSTDPLPS